MLNNKNTFQEAAWEPTPRPSTSGTQLLETLRAKSEAKLGTKSDNIMSALQSRAKQKWYSKAPQDHFDANSVAALGIGNVDYNTLRQMAYDGRITITDPGEWQKLTVSWADGWGPEGRVQPENDLATSARSRVSAAGSAGDVQRVELHGGQQKYGFVYPETKTIENPGYRITPGSEEQKALVDAILAAKMGDTERSKELAQFWEEEDVRRAAGGFAKYLSDPEFAKYAALGAAIKNPDYIDANLRGAGSTGASNRAEIRNIVTFSRENKNILENSGDDFRNAGVDNKNGSSLFLYMKDTEVDLYNYLLAKEGEDTAMEYLHYIEDSLKARRGQARAEDIAGQRGGAWGDIDYILNSGGLAFASGVDRTLKGFEQYGTEEKIAPSTLSYADYFFSKDLKNPIDKLVYGIVNQVGGMAPMLLTTIAAQAIGIPAPVTAALGATMVGIPAAGNAYTEALERGHSKLSARIYAECVGIGEAGLQYVLGGIGKAGGIAADSLLTKIAAWDKAIFRFAGTIAVKGGAEAFEENLQNFLEPLFASVILGEEYDLPTWEEIIYTTLVSGATGIIMDADAIVDTTLRGDGTNGVFQKDVAIKEFAQEKLRAAIQKVTGKKATQNTATQSAQNAAESVSAGKGVAAQAEAANAAADAGAASTGVNAKSARDEMFADLIRKGQENRAKAEAEKKSPELTPQQKSFFDSFFGYEKAVSKSDTATETQNMNAAQLRQQIEAEYAAGNMTEAEYDAALDALMEQESLEGVNTLDRYNPAMMGTEVNDNVRGSVSDDRSQRAAGESAGEQAGELAEGTGRDQSGQVQGKLARDRADHVARIYGTQGQQPVTARSYLGSKYAEDAGQIYDVPQSVIDGDAELSEIAADIRSRGLVPHLFTGEARLVNGSTADAMIRGNDVYIRVDSPTWTATQNWEHEKFHGILGKSREMIRDLWQQMRKKMPKEKLWAICERYREAYHGILDVDADGNSITGEELTYRVAEEILADAYAGKDTFAQDVEQFSDIASDAANQIEEGSREIRGPPVEKMSAAGVKAKTADLDALSRAEEMERRGVDEDTIYRDTGWYREADEMWRFWISDRNMKYRRSGDAEFRRNHPEYAEYQDLTEKMIFGTLTEKEHQRLLELNEVWGKEHGRLSERVARGNATLGDIIDHPELFAAYPEMKTARVLFGPLGNYERGFYNRRTGTITLSENLRNAPEKTLIHEIQHAIQQIEGFEGGASKEYWENQIESGEQIKTSSYENAMRRLGDFARNPDNAEAIATSQMLERAATDEDYDSIYAAAEVRGLTEKMGQYNDLLWEVEKQRSRANNLMPSTLYSMTAGEREAREVAGRMNWSDEQLKASRPYQGEEVVFADGAEWSVASEYDPETSSIKEQLKNSREMLNKMDIVASVEVPTNLPNKDTAAKWADVFLRRWNGKVDRQGYGEIFFSKKDLDQGLRYSDTPEERAALAVLPQVLKRGRKIGEHDDHKARSKKTITFAAPVMLNGTRVNVAVVVNKNGNHYYAHRVVLPDGTTFKFSEIKKDAAQELSRGVTVSGSLADTTSAASEKSVPQERKSVKGSENFSASGTTDPVQDLPKKAQRILETEERKLTNLLANALRIPYKSRSEQMDGIARAITTEFLKTGNVSEKTIEDLFEKAYRPNEQKLAEEHGVFVDEYRDQMEQDFKAQVNNLIAQLRLANRYAADQAADGTGTSNAVPTLADLPELYADMKSARRAADKAVARNLLTESDNMKVNRLLRGDIDEAMLNPLTDNVAGILEVFQAKTEYEKFARQIRSWNKQRKTELYALADKLLETAGEWKDKAFGLLYSRETMERNIRDIVKDKKVAEEIINTLFKPIHDAAAKANTMKNQYRDRVRALKLSRKVASGNTISEAAAVQLLGEAEDNIRYLQTNKFIKERDGKSLEDWQGIVQDLWENNPNLDAAKIRNAVNEFRQIYDELFEQMNDARMRNGYEPVNYRKGYFPHFQSDSGDGILSQFGKSLGINTAAMQLPTTINGMTHTFKPGIQWFGSAQQRQGVNTSFDAVEGFDSYIEGVADVIHQTDNIQRLRAFAAQVRYRTGDDGLREQIDQIRNDPRLTDEEKQNEISRKWEEGKFELAKFAVELDEYTNILAGKKSNHDRMMETDIGRKAYAIMTALENRVAANMVAVNPGSWLTNFIPITQGWTTLDSRSLLAGMWDTLRAIKNDDGMVAMSSFLTNRRGSDPIVRTWAQNASEVLSRPMSFIDSFTADSLVRARYNQNIRRGMSEDAAIADADAWAAGVMADRSKGSMPTLFYRKNPLVKLFTQFQLEVNNQLSYVFKDIPREMREKGIAALAMAMLKFMIGAFLYNELYEYFIGRRPALDPLGIINDTAGDLIGYELPNLIELGVGVASGDMPSFEVEKKGVYDAGVNLATAVAEELPFVGGLMGGGRLPINSALPDAGKLWQAFSDDSWAGEKRLSTAAKELAKPAAYILPPFGGGQLKKAVEGAAAVARGGSYSVDSTGADILQYPIENDTFGQAGRNAVMAMLFGKSSLPSAREWVENGFNSLSAKETDLFDSLRENGATTEQAYDLIRDLQNLESKLEKITEIANVPYAESLKEIAMANQMSFGQYEKYMAARAAGISTEAYAEFLNNLAVEARKQKEERQEGKPTDSQIESEMWGSNDLSPSDRRNIWDKDYHLTDEYEKLIQEYEDDTDIGAGSVSKKVLRAVLKDSKLTNEQKRAIWESYGWTDSPW